MTAALVRAVAVVYAIHEGFWLAVLREPSLQHITSFSYAQQSSPYASAEHNRMGLFEWERQAVEKFFPAAGRVLLAAAGGGREAFALLQRGFEVVAFDSSEELVRSFGERLPSEFREKTTIVVSTPHGVPLELGSEFDCGIVGWGAFTHMTSPSARIDFLRAFASKVRSGAPILISFHIRPDPSKADWIRMFVARCVSLVSRGRRVELGDRFRLDIRPTFLHLITREELEQSLTDAGLTLQHYEDVQQGFCIAVRSPRERV